MKTAPLGPEGGIAGGAAARDQLGRRFVFRLTPADMIAYEMAVQRLDWRTRIVLTVVVGVAGLTVAALPASLPPWLWWLVVGLLLVGAVMASVVYTNLGIRRRARAHFLPAGETMVGFHAEGVVEASGGRERSIPYVAVGGVLEARDHVFLKVAERPVVLPLAALGGADDMVAAAEWLRETVFRARRAGAASAEGN